MGFVDEFLLEHGGGVFFVEDLAEEDGVGLVGRVLLDEFVVGFHFKL